MESSVLQRTLKKYIPKDKQKSKEEYIVFEAQETFTETVEDEFVIDDLDIEKGLMYCGSKENYLQILTSQRDSGREIFNQALCAYEKGDWKNYVIFVHGIKSAMMSIGAVNLSEMAKGLEFAGKREDYDYIHKRHIPMTEEYKRIMKVLEECPYLEPKAIEEVSIEKPELSVADFDAKLVELENATYEFDAAKVMPILDNLSSFAYHGKDLANELKPVYKKVEMFDFMSAYETVVKIKEKL